MMLTTAINQAYPFTATEKNVVRIGLLVKAAIGRKVSSNAAFLLSQCAHDLWAGWAGAARPPVRFSGSPTCLVPPALIGLGVGGSLNELKSEHIMSTIIPVVSRIFRGKPTQAVNARELHSFLESSQEYSNWIKGRIKTYGFVEQEDFCLIKISSKGRGGHNAVDHYITLDMAKELAMVERTDKGREARRYFIECEKQLIEKRNLKSLPDTKKYHYPRNRLEQPYFAEKKPASLSLSMLANTKEFTSQLKALLNELRTDGHNVDAAWDEYQAMDEIIRHCDGFMDEVIELALSKKLNYSNYSLRNK